MKMKITLCVGAVLLIASAVLFADEATDEYKKLMQPGARANMALQAAVKTDLYATILDAVDTEAAFAKIEAYWAQKNTDDAVGFAKQVESSAKAVEMAARAGDRDAATAAASKIAAGCAGCHMAHRTQLPNNMFALK